MVRHKNQYGRWENIDRLPVRDCGCDKCENARNRRGNGRARRITESAIGAAVAFGGVVAEPPVKGVLDTGDAYERSRSSVVDNRDEYLDEQTRAANDRKGGSSRRR